MKLSFFLGILISSILIISCATLKDPTIIKNDNIQKFRYVYILPTNSLTSSSGITIGNQYYASSKTVNPSDIISGILSKQGFIRFTDLKNELLDETLIVNYGESGRRNTGLGGYTIEVTIQFISAKSNTLISSCSAEGQGSTEADDIRIATNRCLNTLINQK